MLLLNVLLVPVALTVARHVDKNDYVLTIDKNTLKEVRITGESPDSLNLSNLGLGAVDPEAFAHLTNLKVLNLAGNSLKKLPESIFANFTNLEHLDLADNGIESGNFYQGLSSLKTLNISNNPVNTFEAGHFFGLTKSTNILTHGFQSGTFAAAMFENPSVLTRRLPTDWIEEVSSFADIIFFKDDVRHAFHIAEPTNWDSNLGIKVCIRDGHLKSLEVFKKNENLANDCHEVYYERGNINLRSLGIKTFESGWYRLKDVEVRTLNFDSNEITQFTKELLNDLPGGISQVRLTHNKIERLQRGVIENNNGFGLLDLSYNRISEIEDGALEKLNLTDWLHLDNNRLNNTKFLDSLPSHIRVVTLVKNNIRELSPGNFSKFQNFARLELPYNHITTIKAHQLRGFSSLTQLGLSNNSLTEIEPGFFRGLKNLITVDLSKNSISSLEKGVFSGLEKIKHIHLDTNKFTEIPSDAFTDLPNSLQGLSLGDNQIERLKAGTFANVPTTFLDLSLNRISNIERGSFNLPNLKVLDLGRNLLTEIDGDSFEGLGNLCRLSLENNRITTIKKGAAKNLDHLFMLDISRNSIKVLDNGALFGLPKTADTQIKLYRVPLESIKGGLFDDV